MEEYLASYDNNYGPPSPSLSNLHVPPAAATLNSMPKIIEEGNLEHSSWSRPDMLFPLQRGNELVMIQFSDCVNQHKISQDHHQILNDDCDSPVVGYISPEKLASGGSKKIFYGAAGSTSHVDPNTQHNKEKKMVHREIERQRRKDMATLHSSLRSLLPLEFIKGKRSVSDQMNEAVNYIKQMQKNIKALSAKREELKKLSNSALGQNCHEGEMNKHASRSTFTVHQNNNGALGIEITSGFRAEEVIPLSKLLELLFQEGLEVVTCLSTEVNGRLLHSLHCEVKNSNCVDLSDLRRKFVRVIPSFRCSN